MKILVRKVPKDTHSNEVQALVRDVHPKRLFFDLIGAGAEPEILECKRYRATDPVTGLSEDWCLLRIRPEEAAFAVIKKLNGTILRGRHLVVKQYIDRAPPQEHWDTKWGSERRRELIIEEIDEPREHLGHMYAT